MTDPLAPAPPPQYFVFYASGAPNGGSNQCFHREAGALTRITNATVGGSWNTPSLPLVMFEVRSSSVCMPVAGCAAAPLCWLGG